MAAAGGAAAAATAADPALEAAFQASLEAVAARSVAPLDEKLGQAQISPNFSHNIPC